MEPLLYLVHRIPYPPNKGDKIRSYHILKHLAPRYAVHLGAFVDIEDDFQYAGRLESMCASLCLRRLGRVRSRVRCLRGFVTGEALTIPFYRDQGMQQWVDEVIRRVGIRKVLVFSSAMAQYVNREDHGGLYRIIDFVDVDSGKWEQYAKHMRWPDSWIYMREAKKLLDYERKVAACFDHSIFVSQEEARYFNDRAPALKEKIRWMRNGVDLEYFDPNVTYPNPYPDRGRYIVFTGAMDYWANIDAVTWFAGDVLPRLRACFEDLRFYIVGANPSPEVSALTQVPGVVVTGKVADVRPYIQHADAVVTPLRIARGIQNKVLEAMAMAKPVVASQEAAEGIGAVHGHEILIANGAGETAEMVTTALDEGVQRIGIAARTFVERHFKWSENLSLLDHLLRAGRDEELV